MIKQPILPHRKIHPARPSDATYPGLNAFQQPSQGCGKGSERAGKGADRSFPRKPGTRFFCNAIGPFFRAAFTALLLASTGCSYFEQRADDFLDCFRAGVGAGYGAEATVRAGPLVGSIGAWIGSGAGWMGRHRAVTYETTVVGMPFTNIALPLVILVAGDLAHSASGGSVKSYWYLFPLGLLGTTASLREYKGFSGDKEEIDLSLLFVDVIDLIRGGDGRVDDWRDYFWIGLSVHVFIGAEFGFNVAEFADFLLGWFGLDLAGDDGEKRADQGHA